MTGSTSLSAVRRAGDGLFPTTQIWQTQKKEQILTEIFTSLQLFQVQFKHEQTPQNIDLTTRKQNLQETHSFGFFFTNSKLIIQKTFYFNKKSCSWFSVKQQWLEAF